VADIKSEPRPASNRNRWPASYWNAWPASSESAYVRGGIANWRDFVAMAALVRSSLGVSRSVWEEAVCVMG
jgi:replication initiation protein RepC